MRKIGLRDCWIDGLIEELVDPASYLDINPLIHQPNNPFIRRFSYC
jgi:hypothetical protein